jgi:hypothetical protein
MKQLSMTSYEALAWPGMAGGPGWHPQVTLMSQRHQGIPGMPAQARDMPVAPGTPCWSHTITLMS